MPILIRGISLFAGLAALSSGAWGGIGFLTQDRSITASTSADGNSQTIAAPGFGAFVASLNLSTTFQTPGGGTGTNKAGAGIDCQLDPDAIVVNGSLFGAGGLSVGTGTPRLETGDAAVSVSVGFQLDVATPFSLFASRRPSDNPGDRFKIKLKDPNGNLLVFVDQTMPAQEVNLSGVLIPGVYSLDYEAQFSVDGDETIRDLSFNMQVPSAGGLGLLAASAGLLVRRRRSFSQRGVATNEASSDCSE